jgi:UDP-2,3-diacylglucosamine pyrophosphatase LpxH
VQHARKRGVAGVICGHTHFSEDTQCSDIHYVNTGCWTEAPCSYVLINGASLTLHHVSD